MYSFFFGFIVRRVRICGRWSEKKPAGAKTGSKVSGLFTDERCSKAILDFLATTEVGWTAGPLVADEEPGSEVSERDREGNRPSGLYPTGMTIGNDKSA